MLRLKWLFFVSLLAFILPDAANAHTRWFTHGEIAPYATIEPVSLYLFVIVLVAIGILAFAYSLEKRGKYQLKSLMPRASHAFSRAGATFSMVTGAFLMIAGTHDYLFSPNLTHEAVMPMILIYAQFLIGLGFLLGVFARVAALALAAIWTLGIFFAGLEPMLENTWVLSTAAFVFVMGADYFSMISVRALAHLAKKYHSYALPLLRIGSGATLLILGFTEKIMHPEFGINFLSQYDWNFMEKIGIPYSDLLFTFSAGAVESLLGLLLILGILTRATSLVVLVLFTIPIFLLGPIELTGHLPHLAGVVLLLMFGAGEHLRLVHSRKAR